MMFALLFVSSLASALSFNLVRGEMPGAFDPYVNCHLGNYAGPCFLDTGSRVSNFKFNENVSVYAQAPAESLTGAAGVTQTEPAYIANVATAGEFKASRLKVTLPRATGAQSKVPRVGADFFLNATAPGQCLVIDTDRRSLLITKAQPRDGKPLTFIKGALFGLPVWIGSDQVLGLFDSGSQTTVIDSAFVAAHGDEFLAVSGGVNVTDVQNRVTHGQLYYVRSLRIGSLELHDALVSSLDLSVLRGTGKPVYAIIGLDTILQGDWIFNLHAAKWNVVKAARPSPRARLP